MGDQKCDLCSVNVRRVKAYKKALNRIRRADGSGDFPEVTAEEVERAIPALESELAELDKYATARGESDG